LSGPYRSSERSAFERSPEQTSYEKDNFFEYYEEKSLPVSKSVEETSMQNKFEEYERRLHEKDRQIAELEINQLEIELQAEVKQLVTKNLTMMGELQNADDGARANLENAYREILIKSNPKYKKLREKNNE
jgi:predicted phosphohydrolase